REAFQRFAGLLQTGGRLIVCADDPGARELIDSLNQDDVALTTYGLDNPKGGRRPDVLALDTRPNQMGGVDFVVDIDGQTAGLARIRLPGLHNVRNALAALVAARAAGVEF